MWLCHKILMSFIPKGELLLLLTTLTNTLRVCLRHFISNSCVLLWVVTIFSHKNTFSTIIWEAWSLKSQIGRVLFTADKEHLWHEVLSVLHRLWESYVFYQKSLSCLLLVQNAAARVLTHAKKWDHVSLILASLSVSFTMYFTILQKTSCSDTLPAF